MWNARYKNTQVNAFLIYPPISSYFFLPLSFPCFLFPLTATYFFEWTLFLKRQLDQNTFGIDWSIIEVYTVVRNMVHILVLSWICMYHRFDVFYCLVQGTVWYFCGYMKLPSINNLREYSFWLWSQNFIPQPLELVQYSENWISGPGRVFISR